MPRYTTPVAPSLGHADLLSRSAGRAEGAVDQGLRPSSDVRQERESDRRGVPYRRRLEGLGADDQADIKQDR